VLNIKISAKGAQFLHLICQGAGAGRPPLPRLEIGIKNQMFLEKPEAGILIPINWFESYNDSFFAGMKLTLHKSQVHTYSLMQWWACSSLMPPPLCAEVGCKSRERIILLLVFIA